MTPNKRFWIIIGSFIVGMTLIACSCSSLNNIIPNNIIPNILPTSTSQVPIQSTTNPSVNTTSYTSLPYYDDFSDPSSGWDVYSSDNVDEGYSQEGYYFLISKTIEYTEDAYANKFFKDTIIEVDATTVDGLGDKYFEYGVSCRVQSNYDGYDFSITTDGYFSAYLVTDGGSTYTSLLQGDEYQQSYDIMQGYNTNHFKVTCDGSHLKFEINGVTLFDGQDTTFQDGDIRFFTTLEEDIPNEVIYENLSVTAP